MPPLRCRRDWRHTPHATPLIRFTPAICRHAIFACFTCLHFTSFADFLSRFCHASCFRHAATPLPLPPPLLQLFIAAAAAPLYAVCCRHYFIAADIDAIRRCACGSASGAICRRCRAIRRHAACRRAAMFDVICREHARLPMRHTPRYCRHMLPCCRHAAFFAARWLMPFTPRHATPDAATLLAAAVYSLIAHCRHVYAASWR